MIVNVYIDFKNPKIKATEYLGLLTEGVQYIKSRAFSHYELNLIDPIVSDGRVVLQVQMHDVDAPAYLGYSFGGRNHLGAVLSGITRYLLRQYPDLYKQMQPDDGTHGLLTYNYEARHLNNVEDNV